MDTKLLKVKWSRPQTTEFPKIWKTFLATDINSEQLVEYRIQDLPESRFDDAIKHMISNYLQGEPVTCVLSKFIFRLRYGIILHRKISIKRRFQ